MKQYIKPAVEVVELAVKENIAGLPNALVTQDTNLVSGSTVTLTTYNLAAQNVSEA